MTLPSRPLRSWKIQPRSLTLICYTWSSKTLPKMIWKGLETKWRGSFPAIHVWIMGIGMKRSWNLPTSSVRVKYHQVTLVKPMWLRIAHNPVHILDPQNDKIRSNVCHFKSLHFGVVCYVLIDNYNKILLKWIVHF